MNLSAKKEQENQKKLFTKPNKPYMKKSIILSLLFVVSILLLSSCADSQHQVKAYVVGYEYGFFSGAWHGTISPFSFIGSLFSDDISIYAINNNGAWYDLGYVLGLIVVIKLGAILLAIILSILKAIVDAF